MEIKKGVAYWCKTEKLAKEFLTECDKQGIKWCFGALASSCTKYEDYGEDTCYMFSADFLSYCCKDFFSDEGYKVIEYQGTKKQKLYNSKVIFETSFNYNGNSYLTIYGKHINGYFCCFPGLGKCSEMAEPNDLYYNAESLEVIGFDEKTSEYLARQIKNTYCLITSEE